MKVKSQAILISILTVVTVFAIVFASLYLKSQNIVKGYNNHSGLIGKTDTGTINNGVYEGKLIFDGMELSASVTVENHGITKLEIMD